jgi:hypothetical protein
VDSVDTPVESNVKPFVAPVGGPARKMLNINEILTADDIRFEEIEVPEWGGWVRVRTLCAEESARFSDEIAKDKKNGIALLLIMTLVDTEGKQLFTNASLENLRKKSMKAMLRVQKIVLEMNGLTDEKKTETKNA